MNIFTIISMDLSEVKSFHISMDLSDSTTGIL